MKRTSINQTKPNQTQRKFEEYTETHPLKDLLPSDILQPPIQVLHLLHNILDLTLIRTLDGTGLPNRQIQSELDSALGMKRRQPTRPTGRRRRREADLVVAGIRGAEGEPAR